MGAGRIVLFSTLTVVLLTQIIAGTHAITRGDIYHMKNDIDTINERITGYEESIREKSSEIDGLEGDVDKYKEKERTAREWDRLNDTSDTRKELENARKQLKDSEERLQDAKRDLDVLLDAKNTAIIQIDTLERELARGEDEIRENSRTGLAGLTKFIGIDTSRTCKILIKNGFDTDCPSMELLEQLDSSRDESGVFQVIDGEYRRGPSLVQNDHELYQFDKSFGIIVDPSPNIASRIKMITIEPSLDTYLTAYDLEKKGNTRTVNHDRFVDSCRDATITATDWKRLLPDTIHYLRTGCTITGYDEVEHIEDKSTDIDISTSRHWQEAKTLEEDKMRCKVLCFEY